LRDVDLKNEFKDGGEGKYFSFSKEGGLKFNFMYNKNRLRTYYFCVPVFKLRKRKQLY